MQNTQQSNAPTQCPCSPGCIATMRLTLHKRATPEDGIKRIITEVDVCSTALDEITRALRLLPEVHWTAEKLVPRAVPMPQSQPDDKTRPVMVMMPQADSLTAPMSVSDLINGVEAVRLSSCADPVVEAIDDEISGVIDTGLPTPLPLVDDPTTNAVPDRPLPSLAHRIYVLKRLVEAFDAVIGFRSGDISIDRKVSFDEDLAAHGARHQTMTVPVGASTFAGKLLNARVETMKGNVTLHVYRFEEFVPWMEKLAADGFHALAPNLDQLDEKLHAGAFKFLRLVASQVARRAAIRGAKTAYFEFV